MSRASNWKLSKFEFEKFFSHFCSYMKRPSNTLYWASYRYNRSQCPCFSWIRFWNIGIPILLEIAIRVRSGSQYTMDKQQIACSPQLGLYIFFHDQIPSQRALVRNRNLTASTLTTKVWPEAVLHISELRAAGQKC